MAGPGDATLCVGPDRILRAPREDGTCPPDHEELELTEDDQGLCELCDPNEDPPPPDPSGDAEVAALERRIRALEDTAYFEVVTSDERPVFRVGRRGARLYNRNGVAVAAAGVSGTGGYFTGRSASIAAEASIGASADRGGVRLIEQGLPRMHAAMQGGSAALRLPSMAGTIAGLGQSLAGSGTLVIGTIPGAIRGSLTAGDGRGMIAVAGPRESGGVALLEPVVGGGMLGIDDTRGNAAVKMGHNGHRYGIVMAGPVLGLPLVPRSGLPGSYFMGCAAEARPACVPSIDP